MTKDKLNNEVLFMNVVEIKDKLSLQCVAGENGLSKDVTGCYIGDLLSLAMAKVEEGYGWITIQTNINIVAVASLRDASCVILADGQMPDDNTVEKANEEDIAILSSPMSAYELAKGLAELGI